jgi:3-dehydroquinate synthase class II
MSDAVTTGKVTKITPIGEGLRVCLDFIDELDPLEGVWIGNTGSGYCLALAENRETDTYPKRPFRVNAGAYHHYLVKEKDTTTYLAEVAPGDVLTVKGPDTERLVTIGRVKKEYRPFLRIELETEEQTISVTVQDADSVYLLSADKTAIQAQQLTAGDTLTVRRDQPGRHLGERIEEDITEI